MKTFKTRTGIFWGLVLIAAAVLLILNGIGVELGYGLSVWRIILGVLCLAWVVDTIAERRFTELPFPLAFLFLVFEPTIAHALGREDNKLIPFWTVLLAALLLTIGLKAIVPEKPGKKHIGKMNTTVYLDGAELSDASIHDNAGSVTVYVSNPEEYAGGGTIRVHDNLGKVTLHLPSTWNVTVDTYDNLGSVDVPENEGGEKTVAICAHDNVGKVSVVFD